MSAGLSLEAQGLTVLLGGARVLEEVSLAAEAGRFTAVLGPNGSGKSTLLRCLYRALLPAQGTVRLDGRALTLYSRKEIGRRVAVLRQEEPLGFDFQVEEVVRLGRAPHLGAFASEQAEDRRVVREAMAMAGIEELAGRSVAALSGGERQRVLLARALAQRPGVLLLDEPTNHLDVRHQLEVLERVAALKITVIAALHDLNLALRFASRAVLLSRGRVEAAGAVAEVLEPGRVGRVFGVEVAALAGADGLPVLTVLRR